MGNYLGRHGHELAGRPVGQDAPEVRAALDAVARTNKLLSINGKRSPDSFHRELGKLMWDKCDVRGAPGLNEALELIPALREEFWENVCVPGSANNSTKRSRRPSRC